ncbi:MAG: phosphoglucosamine mutase [Bacteroidetes bacterium]|nr:phosphoglucosamine mutase [Bacteroidota bacterium]
MALIKSISGIRGTIGGAPGESLSPVDVVKFVAAFSRFILEDHPGNKKIVIGRDGRISGEMMQSFAMNTLRAMGLDVLDAGLSTTPTIEMAVIANQAAGGIILSASHNPKEWNALKFFNDRGEFISASDGEKILKLAEENEFIFAPVDAAGSYTIMDDSLQYHINAIINHPLVNIESIRKKNFHVVVDAINSTGAIAVPALLDALGVENYSILNAEVTGNFQHNPEPLPAHLQALSLEVQKKQAHLGIAVDPDVDRLCFVCEDGSMFGEEYTLVAVADYVLQHRPGNTVSNLSSTQALRDITEKQGGTYYASAVGEVNVVNKMKEVNAIIGGEGNGGIIVPELHYGRDALIGIGLFLSQLATSGKEVSALRAQYPNYFICKEKIDLGKNTDAHAIFDTLKEKYKKQPMNTEDGLKIFFDKDWVHLRTSNTEPIIRIYAESHFETTANNIARRIQQDIRECM